MYTPHKKYSLLDSFKTNVVYRCRRDIVCKNGVFERDSPVYIEYFKTDRSSVHPDVEYIKIFDFRDYLKLSSRKSKTQDIPQNVNGYNFEYYFKRDDEATKLVKNSEDLNSIDKYEFMNRLLNRISVALTVIFSILVVLGIGSFLTKWALENVIGPRMSDIFTAIYKTSLTSSIFVLVLLAIFTLIKNKLIGKAKYSYMSSLNDICEQVYNSSTEEDSVEEDSVKDDTVEDNAVEENDSVEDKTVVISKEDSSKNEDVSEDTSIEGTENYDNNWFTESIDNFFNKKEN